MRDEGRAKLRLYVWDKDARPIRYLSLVPLEDLPFFLASLSTDDISPLTLTYSFG
jgi:hypothetical protein